MFFRKLYSLENQYSIDNNMRKVIGIGETLLDIIFKDNKPMEAVPGGSTFNAIVSLGRVGANATFVTETMLADLYARFSRRTT